MQLIMKIAATMAAIIHILFFCMESLLWKTPQVQKIFKLTPENAMVTELLAFNQGFYNLFLALGVFIALVLIAKKKASGITLLAYTNACMLGAALVLLCSAPNMTRGFLLQGIPPLITLLCIWNICGKMNKN